MRKVYYLATAPDNDNALLYPAELDDNYYGSGALFIGQEGAEIDDIYILLAYLREEMTPIELRRVGHTNVLEAVVPGIGRFEFTAIPLTPPSYYVGRFPCEAGPITHRIDTNSPQDLEAAARDHDVLLLGYSSHIHS